MSIKKILTYLLIISSNTSILFSENIDEITISKETPFNGFIKYKSRLPNNILLRCERRLPNKPSCEFLKPGRPMIWQKINWKHWYILRELFELQEKKAAQEVEKFEQEFEEMKKSIKSESELAESLTSKLFSELI